MAITTNNSISVKPGRARGAARGEDRHMGRLRMKRYEGNGWQLLV
jgi:hypothetical protein